MKQDVSSVSPEFLRQRIEKAQREAVSGPIKKSETANNGQEEPPKVPPFGEKLRQEQSDTALRKLTGASFLNFSQRTIDESKTLLGNRYLCRGGGAFIVAPSGQGKSVLVAQAAILWALGRLAFGIRPAKPLRILIIQAEDDEGDIIEMSQIIEHLGLSDEERVLVDANTQIEFVNDATGDEFLDIVDGFIAQWKPDILIINPYTAYLGGDIKDDAVNNHFLRNRLNPILTKHGCAALIIHHTPKTNFRDTDKWKPSDWQYSGAGAACLTNWSRAYLVVDPTEVDGVYKFIAAKRGKRIGWGEQFQVYETYWAHSLGDKLLWVPATNDDIMSAAKTKKNLKAEDLVELVPLVDPISKETFRNLAKEKWKIGRDKADALLADLTDQGSVREIRTPRPGTNPSKKYVRN
jgi:RecA-family ATPase